MGGGFVGLCDERSSTGHLRHRRLEYLLSNQHPAKIRGPESYDMRSSCGESSVPSGYGRDDEISYCGRLYRHG